MSHRMGFRLVLAMFLAPLLLILAPPRGAVAATCPGLDLRCTQQIPTVVVGSPSGLASSYSLTLYTGYPGCHVANSGDLGIAVQPWLAVDFEFCDPGTVTLFTADPNGGSLHCGNGDCTAVDWNYIEAAANPATFHPRFGGFGQIAVQVELQCPHFGLNCSGYEHITCIEARSTDFNADGDTDQDEKISLGQTLQLAPASRPAQYDLNLDGVVDAADYRVLASEMVEEINEGRPTLYTCANPNCSTPPCTPVALNGTFVADASAPGATTLAVSGTGSSVTLSWTSPGDDTYNGQQIGVAKQFDLRGSLNPITAANFDAATSVSGAPAPDLPGTAHNLTVDACSLNLRYFAIKTRDWAGNVSAMSNVVAVPPTTVTDLSPDAVSKTCMTVAWTAPAPIPCSSAVSSYDLRMSTVNITESTFYSASQLSTTTPQTPGSYECVVVNGLQSCKRYYFALKSTDSAGNVSTMSDVGSAQTLCFGGSSNCNGLCGSGLIARDDSDQGTLPTVVALLAPQPNPSSQHALLSWEIPASQRGAKLELAVFDVSGRKMSTISQGSAEPGRFSTVWSLTSDSGDPIRHGVYFVRLKVGAVTASRTLLIGG